MNGATLACRMRKAASFAALLALFGALLPVSGQHKGQSGTILSFRVIDGDTICADVLLDDGTRLPKARLRLARIDAPEMPGDEGWAARVALYGFLYERPARVRILGHERYGRLLVEIEVHGENVSDWLVCNGHAKPYRKRK